MWESVRCFLLLHISRECGEVGGGGGLSGGTAIHRSQVPSFPSERGGGILMILGYRGGTILRFAPPPLAATFQSRVVLYNIIYSSVE